MIPRLERRRRRHHSIALLLMLLDIRLTCDCRTFAGSLLDYILLELLTCDTCAFLRHNCGPTPQILVMYDWVPRTKHSISVLNDMGLRQFLVSSLRRDKILIASFSSRSRIVLLLLKS